MLPKFDTDIQNTTFEVKQQPNLTYRDNTENISGTVDRKQAIEQMVRHVVFTERYAYEIYPDTYGMEMEKYIGRGFEYLEATIENDLRNALMQDDRVKNVKVTKVEKSDLDKALISFEVYTTEGIIETEIAYGL